jgi:MYXO-CTERM domain-containing protein
MKRTVVAPLVSVFLLGATSLALAQSPPRDAGASADEAFSPGPGGGEPDAGGKRPPLESTGLEDTDFGCSCRTADSASHGAGSLALAGLVAGAAWRRRRSQKSR